MSDSVVDTGRTNQLADDNTFCAIDYESTGLSHQRKITHEDLMLTDFFLLLVIKANLNLKRCCKGSISLFTLFDRILHVVSAEFKIHKFQTQGTAVVSDRRDVVKDFLQAFV